MRIVWVVLTVTLLLGASSVVALGAAVGPASTASSPSFSSELSGALLQAQRSLEAGGGPARGSAVGCQPSEDGPTVSCSVVSGTSFFQSGPTARWGGVMTYDPAGPYVLLFGGSSRSDTWTFAGGHWTELKPTLSPSVRVWSNIAYVAKDGYVLLFGGQASGIKGSSTPRYLYDTWSFSNGTWTNITSSVGTPPDYSYGASMAYDSEGGYVLLFGGMHSGQFSNETWTFTAGHWRDLTALAGTPPPCRFDASLVDDPVAGYVLLFGGEGHQPSACASMSKYPVTIFDDSWSFANGTWKELQPVDSPPPSWMGSMAYDPASGKVLLFGGVAATNFAMADTWTYELSGGVGNWVKLPLAGYPPARFSAMMAYDDPGGYFLLFGGLSETFVDAPLLSDVWTFDGSVWTNLTVAPDPSPRFTMALTYNPNAEFVLMFGGLGQTGTLGDTWKFAGGSWLKLTPPVSPSPRSGAGMAYDARDGYIVLFGGVGTSGNLLNDSWAFESGKTEWVKLTPALSPSPRCNASVVFDAKDDYLVLFGGAGTHGPLSDTWRFAGGKWKELTLSKFPPARSAAGATYDPNAEKVLLFGGEGPSGPLGDTWAFSGGHWTEQSRGGTGLPPARDGASFAYDPLVSSDLLLGGFNHSGPASEVWAYSNGGWAPSSAPASIIGRLSAGFTFDGIDSIMFLVGGTNLSSDGFVADSWTNSSSGWTQLTYPAHFSESGLPPGTIWGVSVGTPEVESSLSDLVLSLPVGSYEYLVEPPTGWQVVGGPASGSFVITGASEPYVSVDFAAT